MDPKLFCLFVVFASTYGDIQVPVPERFPPGVDPALCPDYPNCDNALLHGTERIAAVPTYYRSVVPSWSYVNTLPQFNSLRSVVYSTLPGFRTIAPVVPTVAHNSPAHISQVAPLSTDTPLDPHKPVVPFASSPKFTTRFYTF